MYKLYLRERMGCTRSTMYFTSTIIATGNGSSNLVAPTHVLFLIGLMSFRRCCTVSILNYNSYKMGALSITNSIFQCFCDKNEMKILKVSQVQKYHSMAMLLSYDLH